MIKAGIIGATGYAGNEIVRLLLGHKDVEIKWFGSRSYIDQQYADIYQNFFRLVDAKCMDDNMEMCIRDSPGSVSSASSEERGQYRDAASGLRKHWSRPVQ